MSCSITIDARRFRVRSRTSVARRCRMSRSGRRPGPADGQSTTPASRPSWTSRFPAQKSPCLKPRGSPARAISSRAPNSRSVSACPGRCSAQISASWAGEASLSPSEPALKSSARKSRQSPAIASTMPSAGFPGSRCSADHLPKPMLPLARTHGTRSATRAPTRAARRSSSAADWSSIRRATGPSETRSTTS